MNIYRVSAAHIGGNTYPWAAGYGPLEDMPFLEAMTDEFRKSKKEFWEINPRPSGIIIDPGGRKWSDVMGHGGGLPPFFISERVLVDLKEAGIPFLRATEMPIAKIMARALQKIIPPKYFVLEVGPGIKIRYESIPMEVRIASKKENPGRILPPSYSFADVGSWNGVDLCSPIHGNALTSLFCTDRVKELAERKGWTNVKFTPLKLE